MQVCSHEAPARARTCVATARFEPPLRAQRCAPTPPPSRATTDLRCHFTQKSSRLRLSPSNSTTTKLSEPARPPPPSRALASRLRPFCTACERQRASERHIFVFHFSRPRPRQAKPLGGSSISRSRRFWPYHSLPLPLDSARAFLRAACSSRPPPAAPERATVASELRASRAAHTCPPGSTFVLPARAHL